MTRKVKIEITDKMVKGREANPEGYRDRLVEDASMAALKAGFTVEEPDIHKAVVEQTMDVSKACAFTLKLPDAPKPE